MIVPLETGSSEVFEHQTQVTSREFVHGSVNRQKLTPDFRCLRGPACMGQAHDDIADLDP